MKVDTKEKLTRKRLLQQPDWEDWKQSEYKQLNLYQSQEMFDDPATIPKANNTSILPMIWNYLIKNDGTKKARCVADGSPRQQGSITLANTYAACLEQPGSCLFWGITALKNLLAFGCDCSNAFAEAPAPKAPLYLKIDRSYRQWWEHEKGGKLPDKDLYVKVNHTIQGHP